MKLGDMSDRQLILFNIGETMEIKKLLTNHLHTHEVADERRWKMYLILFGVFVTTIAGLLVTLIT